MARRRSCCQRKANVLLQGLNWPGESPLRHPGASCFRPYKGPGPLCLCSPQLFLDCLSRALGSSAGKSLSSTFY